MSGVISTGLELTEDSAEVLELLIGVADEAITDVREFVDLGNIMF